MKSIRENGSLVGSTGFPVKVDRNAASFWWSKAGFFLVAPSGSTNINMLLPSGSCFRYQNFSELPIQLGVTRSLSTSPRNFSRNPLARS